MCRKSVGIQLTSPSASKNCQNFIEFTLEYVFFFVFLPVRITLTINSQREFKGVTLLAFGNGAPDVFSAVTAITTGDPSSPDEGLGLGFLMGEFSPFFLFPFPPPKIKV